MCNIKCYQKVKSYEKKCWINILFSLPIMLSLSYLPQVHCCQSSFAGGIEVWLISPLLCPSDIMWSLFTHIHKLEFAVMEIRFAFVNVCRYSFLRYSHKTSPSLLTHVYDSIILCTKSLFMHKCINYKMEWLKLCVHIFSSHHTPYKTLKTHKLFRFTRLCVAFFGTYMYYLYFRVQFIIE